MSDDAILDAQALQQLGHTPDEVAWLLARAVRGTTDRPFLLDDEYQRLVLDLPREVGE